MGSLILLIGESMVIDVKNTMRQSFYSFNFLVSVAYIWGPSFNDT
jgi:hypothetical protein